MDLSKEISFPFIEFHIRNHLEWNVYDIVLFQSISLLRYLLVISGKEFGGGILIGVYFTLSAPLVSSS